MNQPVGKGHLVFIHHDNTWHIHACWLWLCAHTFLFWACKSTIVSFKSLLYRNMSLKMSDIAVLTLSQVTPARSPLFQTHTESKASWTWLKCSTTSDRDWLIGIPIVDYDHNHTPQSSSDSRTPYKNKKTAHFHTNYLVWLHHGKIELPSFSHRQLNMRLTNWALRMLTLSQINLVGVSNLSPKIDLVKSIVQSKDGMNNFKPHPNWGAPNQSDAIGFPCFGASTSSTSLIWTHWYIYIYIYCPCSDNGNTQAVGSESSKVCFLSSPRALAQRGRPQAISGPDCMTSRHSE